MSNPFTPKNQLPLEPLQTSQTNPKLVWTNSFLQINFFFLVQIKYLNITGLTTVEVEPMNCKPVPVPSPITGPILKTLVYTLSLCKICLRLSLTGREVRCSSMQEREKLSQITCYEGVSIKCYLTFSMLGLNYLISYPIWSHQRYLHFPKLIDPIYWKVKHPHLHKWLSH